MKAGCIRIPGASQNYKQNLTDVYGANNEEYILDPKFSESESIYNN